MNEEVKVENKSNKKLIIIIAAVILVVIAVVCGIFLFSSKSEKQIEKPLIYITYNNNKYQLKLMNSELKDPITLIDDYIVDDDDGPVINYQNDNSVFIIDGNRVLYYVDLKTNELSPVGENVVGYQKFDKLIYFNDYDGNLYEYNIKKKSSSLIITGIDFILGRTDGYNLYVNKDSIMYYLEINSKKTTLNRISSYRFATVDSKNNIKMYNYFDDDKVVFIENQNNYEYELHNYDIATKENKIVDKVWSIVQYDDHYYYKKMGSDLKEFIKENIINNYNEEDKKILSDFTKNLLIKIFERSGVNLSALNDTDESSTLTLFDLYYFNGEKKLLLNNVTMLYGFSDNYSGKGIMAEYLAYNGQKYNTNELNDNIDTIVDKILIKKSMIKDTDIYDVDLMLDKMLDYAYSGSNVKLMDNGYVILLTKDKSTIYYNTYDNPNKTPVKVTEEGEYVNALNDVITYYVGDKLYYYNGKENILLSENGYYRGIDEEKNIYFVDAKNINAYRYNVDGTTDYLYDGNRIDIIYNTIKVKNGLFLVDNTDDDLVNLYRYSNGTVELIDARLVYFKKFN